MIVKIKTAPTVEPVSLTEMKEFLRLDTDSLADNLSQSQSIVPGAHVIAASYSLKGTGVSVLGYRSVVVLDSGTNLTGGTVDVKIQESDTDSDAAYTDWTGGAFTKVTTDNDNAIQEKEYTGTKQYIRTVATVATATCDFGVSIVKQAAISSDEATVTNCIKTARRYAEQLCSQAFISQTWYYYPPAFPGKDFIKLPYAPLVSVTSLTYYNSAGTAYILGTDDTVNVSTDTNSEPGRIVLDYGESWPTATLRTMNPITIEFVCGYGATSASVPDEIRQWIMAAAKWLYEKRGDIKDFPISLLENFRLWDSFP